MNSFWKGHVLFLKHTRNSEDPGIFWYIYILFNVRTTWHPKRPPFFTRFSTELLDFFHFRLSRSGVFAGMSGIFFTYGDVLFKQKKHRQNTSSNSWRCIQFLQPLCRKPSSFLGWSFHYLCHRVNLSKGTPITVNFPASDVFEMQSNLYDVYDYLNTSDLINHDTWRMAGSLGWMAKIGIIAFEKKHGRIWWSMKLMWCDWCFFWARTRELRRLGLGLGEITWKDVFQTSWVWKDKLDTPCFLGRVECFRDRNHTRSHFAEPGMLERSNCFRFMVDIWHQNGTYPRIHLHRSESRWRTSQKVA